MNDLIVRILTAEKPVSIFILIIISINYIENRPWGSFTVIDEGDGFKVKRLTINPGHSTSMQFHQHRSERWTVVEGEATVILEGVIHKIIRNESIYISLGSKHQLANNEDSVMQLIEVQIGSYLGEDDIVRLEDKYGRL